MAKKITNKRQKLLVSLLKVVPDEKWARDMVVEKYKCDHTEVNISRCFC